MRAVGAHERGNLCCDCLPYTLLSFLTCLARASTAPPTIGTTVVRERERGKGYSEVEGRPSSEALPKKRNE